MSQEDVEIVRAVLDAQRQRDWQAFRRLYDPEIEWEDASGLWGDWGSRHGFEEVRDGFVSWFEAFEHVEFSAETITAVGDEVFSTIRISGRGRESGLVVNQRIFVVWTVHDDRVMRVRAYREEAEALEAAGLRE